MTTPTPPNEIEIALCLCELAASLPSHKSPSHHDTRSKRRKLNAHQYVDTKAHSELSDEELSPMAESESSPDQSPHTSSPREYSPPPQWLATATATPAWTISSASTHPSTEVYMAIPVSSMPAPKSGSQSHSMLTPTTSTAQPKAKRTRRRSPSVSATRKLSTHVVPSHTQTPTTTTPAGPGYVTPVMASFASPMDRVGLRGMQPVVRATLVAP
eukprot:TRINITY_DN2207_c0_g1_i10.p1 TRINITY_DN2207_c0_g1~~TRINITY_DN2207_c0_g1_i10.p1  ORF type:complete len:214 (+),score=58.37 TRINITY_DN2207_c0_g1_i10:58-699(+)